MTWEYPDRTEYWQSCVRALRRCQGTGYLNPEIAEALAEAVQSALWGFPPKAWAKGENCSYNDGDKVRPEAIAIWYVELKKKGVIDDKSPVQTIQRHYGVTRRTYDNWRKKFLNDETLGPIISSGPPSLDDPLTAKGYAALCTDMMLGAAARYRSMPTLKSEQ
jgi:hypothetical protein